MFSLLRKKQQKFCSDAVVLLIPRFKITLELNGEAVDDWKKVNCTTVMFNLPSVWMPKSIVLCKLKSNHLSQIVSGLDLHGGRMYTWL